VGWFVVVTIKDPERVGPELCIVSDKIVQPQPDSKAVSIDERE